MLSDLQASLLAVAAFAVCMQKVQFAEKRFEAVEVLIVENNGNSSWKSEYEMAEEVLFGGL